MVLDVPRRLKRFHRKTEKQKEKGLEGVLFSLQKNREFKIKKDSEKLAMRKVNNFHSKHKRFPNRKELDKISESIFKQIKREQEKEQRKEKAQKKEERAWHKRRGKKGKKIKQEKAPEKAKKEISELKELSELNLKDLVSESSGLELEDIEKEKPLKDLEKELKKIDPIETHFKIEIQTTKNKCPTCKNKTDEIIYCPDCGTGFCTHCALKAEKEKENIKYSCPKCKAKFKVKKH